MLTATTEEGASNDYPKLMANENVVALFTDAETAVVVHRISETAIDVGRQLNPKTTCDMKRFSDYTGSITIRNS